jgi:HD-GYP domain-containing protein (c-di-GMP phosphodiesterase class II)
MISGLSGFDAGLVRSFKEVLFRFLEEVQSTKAALYLLDADQRFRLVCQYGFGRRDALAAEHSRDALLGAMACRQGNGPRYYNHSDEVPELATYLEGAGTGRLLLVPLRLGDSVVGLVDVRDKGRRRPFGEPDAARAADIGQALLRLVSQADLYPGLGLPAPRAGDPLRPGGALGPEPVPRGVAPAPSGNGGPGSTPVTGVAAEGARPAEGGAAEPHAVDPVGIEELLRLAADLVPSAGVVAIAVSLVRADRAATAMLVPGSVPEPEPSLMLRHQGVALRQVGLPAPDPGCWTTALHRVDGGRGRLRARRVASAVLRRGAGWGLVASVLLDADGGAAPMVLARLARAATTAGTESRLRWAGRLAARRLLTGSEPRVETLEEHSAAVSRLSWAMARALGLSQLSVERAAVAGLIHDVGIRRVAGATAQRNETLGAQDRRRYQAHVEHGAEMIAGLALPGPGPGGRHPGRVDLEQVAACDGSLEELSLVVRHHHERWDGQGYPDRLAGTAIPLLSRLVHVAEVYDVLTSPSSYRRTVGRTRALEILRASAGSQLDPDMVEALVGVVS